MFITNLDAFARTAATLEMPKTYHPTRHKLKQQNILNKRPETVGQARSGKSRFDPFSSISAIEEYDELWHVSQTSSSSLLSTSSSASTSSNLQDSALNFPPTLEEFKYNTNPYLAVSGRLPLASDSMNGNGTCWTSPSVPLINDYIGLRFYQARDVRVISIIGSKMLGNIVGQGEEDLTAESWEVWTLLDSQSGRTPEEEEEWVRLPFLEQNPN